MSLQWPVWLVDPPPAADVLIRVTILLAAAWIAHAALRRANPRWRMLLWRGTAVGLVALPLAMLALPAIDVAVPKPAVVSPGPLESTQQTGPTSPTSLTGPTGLTGPTHPTPSELESAPFEDTSLPVPFPIEYKNEGPPAVVGTTKDEERAPAWSWREHAPAIALAAWLAVLLVLACRLWIGSRRIGRILKTAKAAPESLVAECRRIARALGCRREVEVRVARNLSTPFLTGLRRPVLLLPRETLDPDRAAELPCILAHELSHVRTNDLLWSGILYWVSAILWFHPLAWKIRAAHASACEEACDAVSADFVGDLGRYSQTLARVAVDLASCPPTVGGIPMARVSEVRRRLEALRRKVFATPLRRRTVAAACVGACFILGIVGALRFVYAAEERTAAAPGSPDENPGALIMPDPKPKLETVQELQARLEELVGEIVGLRAKYPDMKLTFLDWNDGNGWDIPTELPRPSYGPVLWLKIESLRVAAADLTLLKDPTAIANERISYYRRLGEIGLDISRVHSVESIGQMPAFKVAYALSPERVKELLPDPPPVPPWPTVRDHGDIVPLVKLLAHAHLVWARKLQDEQGPAWDRMPGISKAERYQLFQIELPDDKHELQSVIEELEFVLWLIAGTKEHPITEIRRVQLQRTNPAPDKSRRATFVYWQTSADSDYERFSRFVLESGGELARTRPRGAGMRNWEVLVEATWVPKNPRHAKDPGNNIKVYLKADGTTLFGEKTVTIEQLKQRLALGAQAPGGPPSVVIHAERAAPSERLVEVIDACKLAGIAKVSIATPAVSEAAVIPDAVPGEASADDRSARSTSPAKSNEALSGPSGEESKTRQIQMMSSVLGPEAQIIEYGDGKLKIDAEMDGTTLEAYRASGNVVLRMPDYEIRCGKLEYSRTSGTVTATAGPGKTVELRFQSDRATTASATATCRNLEIQYAGQRLELSGDPVAYIHLDSTPRKPLTISSNRISFYWMGGDWRILEDPPQKARPVLILPAQAQNDVQRVLSYFGVGAPDLTGILLAKQRTIRNLASVPDLSALPEHLTSTRPELVGLSGPTRSGFLDWQREVAAGNREVDAAVRKAMDADDAEERALAVVLWAQHFDPGRIEEVAKYLYDVGVCHVAVPEMAQQVRPADDNAVTWCKATVGDVAGWALQELTNFRPTSAEVFDRWWAANKDYEKRLWYWSRKWASGGLAEGDIERVMAANPKERGFEILLFCNNMSAREWEAMNSLGMENYDEFRKIMPMRHLHAQEPTPAQVAEVVRANPILQQRFDDLLIAGKSAFGQPGSHPDAFRRLAAVAAEVYKGREKERYDEYCRVHATDPQGQATLLVALADGMDAEVRRELLLELVSREKSPDVLPAAERLAEDFEPTGEVRRALEKYFASLQVGHYGARRLLMAIAGHGETSLPMLASIWGEQPPNIFAEGLDPSTESGQCSAVTAFLQAINAATGREVFTSDEIQTFFWYGKITKDQRDARHAQARKIWPDVQARIQKALAGAVAE